MFGFTVSCFEEPMCMEVEYLASSVTAPESRFKSGSPFAPMIGRAGGNLAP